MRAPLLAVVLLAACAGSPPAHPVDELIGRSDVVTLTNLAACAMRAVRSTPAARRLR